VNPLKSLIQEAHRRSLWQVLGIFLAASWGVIEVVDLLTEQVGLPDWTPTMAVVLLLIGLPIVLATAFVQEGLPGQEASGPSIAADADGLVGSQHTEAAAVNLAAGTGSLDRPTTRPSQTKRLLTWRNAIMGGLGAFTLLGISLVAYFAMWTSGIGPFGNLVAQGVLEDGERVVLATFDDRTGEGLGDVVTEALRVDLASASIFDLVDPAELANVLARMQIEPGARFTAQIAREAAEREGIKAVIDGDVAAVGTGYLVTATMRAADGGRAIASFRVTAAGPDHVIAAIDKLSQDIREKSGETLRSIRAGAPLEQVTTSSLDALRLYTESEAAWDSGDGRRTIELLDQAVALDPAFAMAWRRMSALLGNIGVDAGKQVLAATQAFQHRERLTEVERYLAEAYYYSRVEQDRAKTIAGYQNALRVNPDERAALNNLANEYQGIEDFDRAEALYRRAVDGPGRSNTAYSNYLRNRIGAGDFAGAEAIYQEYAAAYPADAGLPEHRFWASFVNGDMQTAREAIEPLTDDPALPAFTRANALDRMGQIAYWEGRLGEGRRFFLAAERVGREVGGGFELTRRQWTIYSEFAVGDAAWALRYAQEVIDDGTYDAIDPVERNQFFVALNLSLLGDRARAERVIDDYETLIPEAERGIETRMELFRVRLNVRVASGDTAGALVAMVDAVDAYGCSTCFRVEAAWIAERTGQIDEAIRRHETAVEGGFSFFELNGPYRLRSTLVLGPLYEQAGDTAKAIEAYQRVVDQWSNADARGMLTVRTRGRASRRSAADRPGPTASCRTSLSHQ